VSDHRIGFIEAEVDDWLSEKKHLRDTAASVPVE
jgi:hypothetical protein